MERIIVDELGSWKAHFDICSVLFELFDFGFDDR